MLPAFPANGYAVEDVGLDPTAGSSIMLTGAGTESVEPEVPDVEEAGDAVKVIIRVRPPLERELKGFRPYAPATAIDPTGRGITLSENLRAAANNGVENGMVYNTYRFAFDRVYGTETPQQCIYEESARGAITNVLQGYNASIIAFGQTGAGKTHTMTGDLVGDLRGIIPRAVDDVFSHIQRDTGERCKFLVRASYLQIYNEVISDLLKPEAKNLAIREDKRRGVHVDGLSEWVVRTPGDVYALMERGAAVRTTGATKLNELSSRSHAIFILIVEKSSIEENPIDTTIGGGISRKGTENNPLFAAHLATTTGGYGGASGSSSYSTAANSPRQTIRVGKLNLVDLAGSERVHLTGAKGKRLEESKKINQSLSALGNVIAALTDPKGRDGRPHIPYRDSKLTRILEDSLGGNCKTTFMAMISPAVEAFAESLSTLKFAHRAKCVRNAPRVNEDVDHATLLRKYEKELRRLRAELQQRSKDLVDRRLVLQIDEARRREQADKIAAITALERQSAEIARQKAAMSALQNRIASMQSQLLIGGQNVEDTPAFRTLLAAEQARIREQYASRVAELEKERSTIAEDRAQAERFKHLLMKQRDVMVALTQRLAERDREVLALQAQVESADVRAKEAEDALDKKMAELIAVRKSVVVAGKGADLFAGNGGGVLNNNNRQDEEYCNGHSIAGEGGGGGGEKNQSDWKIPSSPGPGNPSGFKVGAEVVGGPLEVHVGDLLASSTSSGRSTACTENGDEEKKEEEDETVEVAAPGPAVVEEAIEEEPQFEKNAFREILEQKILALVGQVEQSISATKSTEAASKARGDGQDASVLERQLRCLRGYVEKTIDRKSVV